MPAIKSAVYLIDATIYDTEGCITYRSVFKSKRGFMKSMNNNRYRLVLAMEYPSLFIIRPENIQEWGKSYE